MLSSDRPQKRTEEQSHCLPCWLAVPCWAGWVHEEWQPELTGQRHPTAAAMRLERALAQPPHACPEVTCCHTTTCTLRRPWCSVLLPWHPGTSLTRHCTSAHEAVANSRWRWWQKEHHAEMSELSGTCFPLHPGETEGRQEPYLILTIQQVSLTWRNCPLSPILVILFHT